MLLVYNMVMIRVNINEAKTKLSSLIEQVEGGKVIQICRRNQPVAELKGMRKPKRVIKGPLGMFRGQIIVHPGAFDPLTQEELKDWYGQ